MTDLLPDRRDLAARCLRHLQCDKGRPYSPFSRHFAVLVRRRATDARWQWYACALTDGESDAVLAALNKPVSLVEARRISISDLPNG